MRSIWNAINELDREEAVERKSGTTLLPQLKGETDLPLDPWSFGDDCFNLGDGVLGVGDRASNVTIAGGGG